MHSIIKKQKNALCPPYWRRTKSVCIRLLWCHLRSPTPHDINLVLMHVDCQHTLACLITGASDRGLVSLDSDFFSWRGVFFTVGQHMDVPPLAHSLAVPQSVTRLRIAVYYYIVCYSCLPVREKGNEGNKKRPSSFSLGRTKSDFVVPPSCVAASRLQPHCVRA